MPKKIDYAQYFGKKFGRIIITGLAKEKTSFGANQLEGICDCGNITKFVRSELNTKVVNSCGCFGKEWAKGMGERNKDRGLADPTESSFNALFDRYKRNAYSTERIFELSIEVFRKLTKENCYYCGDAPKQLITHQWARQGYVYNGIDRVDNSLGYVESNCVPCCKICNDFKRARTAEVFLYHVNKINDFQKAKNNVK